MTDQQHPITPPPELVEKWATEYWGTEYWSHSENEKHIANQAANWGADQELEACVEWLQDPDLNVDTYKLRAARRPKPPSLKEQALELLRSLQQCGAGHRDTDKICRALEALDD